MPLDDYGNYREPGDSFGSGGPSVEPKLSGVELIVAGTVGLIILGSIGYGIYKAVEYFIN